MENNNQVGSKVLFENDRVRVWDFRLEPGETSPLHSHLHDHFYVYVTDNNKISFFSPGSDSYDLDVPDGFTAYHDVGQNPPPLYTHQITNTGSNPHRQLVIEFLGESRTQEAQPSQSSQQLKKVDATRTE